VNTLVILVFAFSFFRPHTKRDWRTFGGFSAFIVALFVEMYGFPLTIYLFYGWLSSHYPGINWFSHDSSHLLQTLLGWRGDAHSSPLHILSNLLIVGGLILLAAAWQVLYRAQRSGTLACSGPYAIIRHPQYVAFMAIMVGFLIQWPTLPTLIMFPVLTIVYVRLAKREEREARQQLGDIYTSYALQVPRFLPRMKKLVLRAHPLTPKGVQHENWKKINQLAQLLCPGSSQVERRDGQYAAGNS
jgi:protein-S-isoprenylcysteine O-methyltransferase Ste14